jgi:tetratricopeptide (TPR) repeat protein
MKEAMVFYETALTKKILNSKTGHAVTFNNMATILYNYADYKKSIRFFNKALEIKPNYLDALRNITSLYVRIGRFSEALESADKLLSERKDSSDFLQLKGFVLLTSGHYDEAESVLKSALDIDPNNIKANLYMGVALSLKGENRKADAFLKQAVLLSPKEIFIYFALIENSIRGEDKTSVEFFLEKLFKSFDKATIISALKRLDTNNIIAPLSQKILADAIGIDRMRLIKLGISDFEKH